MRWPKRTFALPSDILQRFEQTVTAGKRSTVIAELLHEWLDKQRQEQLRRDLIQGCRKMADVYLEIEQDITRWRRNCIVASMPSLKRGDIVRVRLAPWKGLGKSANVLPWSSRLTSSTSIPP